MFRAVYGRIKGFLAWLNGGGRGDPGRSVKDAEKHRHDAERRYGGGFSDSG
jgi:hypothetical protein